MKSTIVSLIRNLPNTYNRLKQESIDVGRAKSNTIVFPPVSGDNQRALTSGLAVVYVDNHETLPLVHLYKNLFSVHCTRVRFNLR